MSAFSLLITPPDGLRPGFTVKPIPSAAHTGAWTQDGPGFSQNAPLPLPKESEASARGLSPVTSSPQDNLFRPVSCYAIFKGWLLLSQPPGCFGRPTCFPT